MSAPAEAGVDHPLPVSATLGAVVAERREAADGVAHLTLRPADGGQFPEWEAGAHIDLHIPGHTRQYSVCSSPANRASLEIAVLREPESRGGSAYVHDELGVGAHVVVGGPRNNFSLAPSRKYLFLAGGIGITPMVPMIEAAEQAGREWRLAYGGRSLKTMAFAQELLAAYGPERILLFPSEEGRRLDLEGLLGIPRALTLVYACGPRRLLDAIEDYCLGWPAGALHLERFAAAPAPEGRPAHSRSNCAGPAASWRSPRTRPSWMPWRQQAFGSSPPAGRGSAEPARSRSWQARSTTATPSSAPRTGPAAPP